MDTFFVITLLVAISNFILGLVVLLHRPRERVNQLFFILCFSISGWVLSNWFSGNLKDYYPALIWTYFTFAFAAIIASSFLFFSFYFPKKITIHPFTKYSLLLVSGFFFIVSYTSLISSKLIILPRQQINDNIYGRLYYPYAAYILLFILVGLAILFVRMLKSSGIERLKVVWVFAGFSVAAAAGLYANLLYPAFVTKGIESHYAVVSPYGPLATVIMAILMSYGIVRYRLMDIRIAIRKGFVQFVTFALLFSVYIYLILFFQRNVRGSLDISSETLLIIAVLVVGVTAEPLRRFIYRWIDRIFAGKEREQDEALSRMQLLARSASHVDEIIEKTRSELSHVFNDFDVAVLKRENNEFTAKGKMNVKIPSDHVLITFLKQHTELLVTDEIPYKLDRYDEDEVRALRESQSFLAQHKIKAVLPLDQEGRVSIIFLLIGKSPRSVLYSEQIAFIKKLHAISNNAFTQAEMYRMAIERIMK